MIDLCALSEEEVLRFFVGQRLLKNKMNCDKCGKTMRINKRAKLIDRIWFSQLLLLLYVWAKNYSNMQAAYETGIKPLNVDHYNDEVYAQAAQGDLDTDCLNRLSECGNGLIDVNCAGTCQRELSGQDHGQNCGPMSDLCSNLAYQDIIKLYCRGTCT
uniref:ShKT domain-containing protein n=1 Tax=Ditylenchus dipsaci TaxID=166011 RepID=A0A915E181_9BILA